MSINLTSRPLAISLREAWFLVVASRHVTNRRSIMLPLESKHLAVARGLVPLQASSSAAVTGATVVDATVARHRLMMMEIELRDTLVAPSPGRIARTRRPNRPS